MTATVGDLLADAKALLGAASLATDPHVRAVYVARAECVVEEARRELTLIEQMLAARRSAMVAAFERETAP